MSKTDYAERASHGELAAAILTGAGHVAVELAAGTHSVLGPVHPQHVYNIGVGIPWAVYLAWRVIVSPGALRGWGLGGRGFLPALRICAVLGVLCAVPLLVYGRALSRLPIPGTFWMVAGLYPLWGLAQQFALQALITRNLRTLVPRLPFRVLAASAVFSASHFPNFRLMALTLVVGCVFVWVFERHRNLWPLGILHGLLGALAYYLVLGQDPGAAILDLVGR